MMKRTLSRKEWRTITGLCLFALIPLSVLLGRFHLPPTWGIDIRGRTKGCSNNLHQLSLAMQSYLQDNDGRLPPTTVGGSAVIGWSGLMTSNGMAPPSDYKGLPVGWADAIIPYFYSESLFMCPVESGTINVSAPSKPFYTDYWMNGTLSGKSKSQILFPSSTILLGEGNDAKDISDATYSKAALPPLWLTDPNSPAFRHLGGANYAMADGSVHWLRPEEVTTFGGRTDAFALR